MLTDRWWPIYPDQLPTPLVRRGLLSSGSVWLPGWPQPLFAPDARVYDVLEQTTVRYRGDFVDEDDAVLPGTTLSTLVWSLYVVRPGGMLQFLRIQQNILNANNGTVDVNGRLVLYLQPSDTTMIDSSLAFERHVALFEWTWPSGRAGKHEVVFNVQNLRTVS